MSYLLPLGMPSSEAPSVMSQTLENIIWDFFVSKYVFGPLISRKKTRPYIVLQIIRKTLKFFDKHLNHPIIQEYSNNNIINPQDVNLAQIIKYSHMRMALR